MFGRFRKKKKIHENVQVEDHVNLQRCTFLGTAQVGYRAIVLEALLRNVQAGRYSLIGRRSSIGAALHDTKCFSTHPLAEHENFDCHPPTIIGNDAWIGDNSIVIAGATIGDGAVVGGGAVVTKDVEPYAIVAGVPARLIRFRFDDETIADLLDLKWWDYGDKAINAVPKGSHPRVLIEELRKNPPEKFDPHYRPFVEW